MILSRTYSRCKIAVWARSIQRVIARSLPTIAFRFPRQSCRIFLVLLGLLFSHNAAQAQYKPAHAFQSGQVPEFELTIHVEDERGASITQASITLNNSAGQSTIVLSNADGMASIKLGNDTYKMTVKKMGFLAAQREISANTSQDMKIKLQIDPYWIEDGVEAVAIYLETIPAPVNTELAFYPLRPLSQPQPGFFKRLFAVFHRSKHSKKLK